MNNELLKSRLTGVMVRNKLTPALLAQEIQMAPDTIRGFLYGRKKPQWGTLQILDEYCAKHEGEGIKYEDILDLVKKELAKEMNGN